MQIVFGQRKRRQEGGITSKKQLPRLAPFGVAFKMHRFGKTINLSLDRTLPGNDLPFAIFAIYIIYIPGIKREI